MEINFYDKHQEVHWKMYVWGGYNDEIYLDSFSSSKSYWNISVGFSSTDVEDYRPRRWSDLIF